MTYILREPIVFITYIYIYVHVGVYYEVTYRCKLARYCVTHMREVAIDVLCDV